MLGSLRSLFLILVLLQLALGASPALAKEPRHCKIAVIGGGPAGVYLSYRLADTYGKDLCLIEKNSELGGRMVDEQCGDVFVGTGARRVNQNQDYVIALAKELGITLETPPERSQLIWDKTRHGYHTMQLLDNYPKVKAHGPLDKDPATSREEEIWQLLVATLKEDPSLARRYPLVKDYMRYALTQKYGNKETAEEALEFLQATSRFQGEFKLPVATANYFEYLELENATSATNLYPRGGMSMFVKQMAKAFEGKVRVYLNSAVTSFSKEGDAYLLKTATGEDFLAEKLIFTVPKEGFSRIKGTLAAQIQKAPQFRAILPVPIVVINQIWDEAWWEKAHDPANPKSEGAVWRAWTDETCVNHVEIPQEPYLAKATRRPTRSVYSDDPNCNTEWVKLYYEKGTAAVEERVVAGLENLFSHPKHPLKVPKPLQTSFHYWPAGWYYVHKDFSYTNKEIAAWAREPLKDHPAVMLAGEGYWLDRPGWSEGAYFSVDALVEQKDLLTN